MPLLWYVADEDKSCTLQQAEDNYDLIPSAIVWKQTGTPDGVTVDHEYFMKQNSEDHFKVLLELIEYDVSYFNKTEEEEETERWVAAAIGLAIMGVAMCCCIFWFCICGRCRRNKNDDKV